MFCFTTGSPVASVPSATHREPLVSVRRPGHPPAPARTYTAAATARGPDRPGLARTALCATGSRDSDVPARIVTAPPRPTRMRSKGNDVNPEYWR